MAFSTALGAAIQLSAAARLAAGLGTDCALIHSTQTVNFNDALELVVLRMTGSRCTIVVAPVEQHSDVVALIVSEQCSQRVLRSNRRGTRWPVCRRGEVRKQ